MEFYYVSVAGWAESQKSLILCSVYQITHLWVCIMGGGALPTPIAAFVSKQAVPSKTGKGKCATREDIYWDV